jgi:lipocalin-like protein
MRILSLLLFLTTSIIAFAQDPVKVDPAHYRVLFENAHMRVLEYRDQPGDKAPMHSHPAYMTYVAGPGKTEDTLPNGQTSIEEDKGGEFDCHTPTTHAGRNVGNTPTQELLVEFKDATNPCSPAQPRKSARDRLIGTWRLVSAGTLRPDGSSEPFPEYGPHPIGYLMYDRTGHMCVTLANPNPPRWADPAKPSDRERALTHRAMNAYCGTYEVRENKSQVIHKPELAEWPHYMGSEQVRNFRLEGNRLILSAEETRPGEERRKYQITWERVSSEDQQAGIARQ